MSSGRLVRIGAWAGLLILTALTLSSCGIKRACMKQGKSALDGACVSNEVANYAACLGQLKDVKRDIDFDVVGNVDGTASAQTTIQSGKAFTTKLSDEAKETAITACSSTLVGYSDTKEEKVGDGVTVSVPRTWERKKGREGFVSHTSYVPIGGEEIERRYNTLPPMVRVGLPVTLKDYRFAIWAAKHIGRIAKGCVGASVDEQDVSTDDTAALMFSLTCNKTSNETTLDDHMRFTFYLVEGTSRLYFVTMVQWLENDLDGVYVDLDGIRLTAAGIEALD